MRRRRGRRDPVKEARDREICALRSVGSTVRQLAARYGLAERTVRLIVQGVAVLVRPRRPSMPVLPTYRDRYHRLRQDAQVLRSKGKSLRSIARTVGVCLQTAHRWVRHVRVHHDDR
mgnify:CR=1 FL=1